MNIRNSKKEVLRIEVTKKNSVKKRRLINRVVRKISTNKKSGKKRINYKKMNTDISKKKY